MLQDAPRGCQRLQEAPRGCQRLVHGFITTVGYHTFVNKLLAVISTNHHHPRGPQRLPEAPRGAQRLPEVPRGSQRLQPRVSTNHTPHPEAPRGSQCLPEAPRGSQRFPEAARGWSICVQPSETIGRSTNSWLEFQQMVTWSSCNIQTVEH